MMLDKVRQRYVLVEAGQANHYYKEMFAKWVEENKNNSAFTGTNHLEQTVKNTISNISHHLKRQDRIVWALHIYRKSLFQGETKPTEDENVAATNWRVLTQLIRGSGELTHLLGNAGVNGYQSVLDYKFPIDAKPVEILVELRNREKNDIAREANKPRNRLLSPDEEHKTLIKFKDGWEWQVVPGGACEKEGKAMRHCGNVPSVQEGDEILSLREPVKMKKKDYWKPHATFILHKDGMLGEMKGFANEKPDRELHPYIIKLLENDKIEGIQGGGYAAQNNFKVSDLPAATMKRLVAEKPELADLYYLYKSQGLKSKRVREWVEKHLTTIQNHEGTDYFVVGEYTDALDFLKSNVKPDYYQDVKSFIWDQDDPLWDTDYGSGARLKLLEAAQGQSEKFKKFMNAVSKDKDLDKYLKDKGKQLTKEELEEALKKSPVATVSSIVEEGYLDWLKKDLDAAINRGYQVGTKAEMLKAMKKYLQDPLDLDANGTGDMEFIWNNPTDFYDSVVWIGVPLDKIMKKADELEEERIDSYYIDNINVKTPPKLGSFSVFNLEAAVEAFEF